MKLVLSLIPAVCGLRSARLRPHAQEAKLRLKTALRAKTR